MSEEQKAPEWTEKTPVKPGFYRIKLWERHKVGDKYEYRATTGYVEIEIRKGELYVIDGYPGAEGYYVEELNDMKREWLGPLSDEGVRESVIQDRARTIANLHGLSFLMNLSVEYD